MYRVPTKNILVNEGTVLSLDVNINNSPVSKSIIVHEFAFEFENSRTVKVELKNDGFEYMTVSDFTYGPGYGAYNLTVANPNGKYLGINSEVIINCIGSTLNIDKPDKNCLNCPLFNSFPCPFCSNFKCLECPSNLLIDKMTHNCDHTICPTEEFVFF